MAGTKTTTVVSNRGTIVSRLDHPVYLKLKKNNDEKDPTDSIVIPPRGKELLKDFTLIVNHDSLPKGLTLIKESK